MFKNQLRVWIVSARKIYWQHWKSHIFSIFSFARIKMKANWMLACTDAWKIGNPNHSIQNKRKYFGNSLFRFFFHVFPSNGIQFWDIIHVCMWIYVLFILDLASLLLLMHRPFQSILIAVIVFQLNVIFASVSQIRSNLCVNTSIPIK